MTKTQRAIVGFEEAKAPWAKECGHFQELEKAKNHILPQILRKGT